LKPGAGIFPCPGFSIQPKKLKILRVFTPQVFLISILF